MSFTIQFNDVNNIINSLVPISRFNKGEANKIFDEVQISGTKVVIKNNKPTCVLLSLDTYEELIEKLSDYILLEEAEKRMEQNNPQENISQEEVMEKYNITSEDLDSIEVELE